MSGYKKIAVAIDLSSESSSIMKRAHDVAAPESEIHLIYVQEPMDSVYMGVVPYGPVFVGMDEVEENLRSELRQKLDDIGENSGVPEAARHFLNGTPAREIRRFAEENAMELIVLGHTGRRVSSYCSVPRPIRCCMGTVVMCWLFGSLKTNN